MKYSEDQRIVLTLDAGGTNFVFSAIRAYKPVIDAISLPAETQNLQRSLDSIRSGFQQVMEGLSEQPVAISFAFPGPADYPNGIINNIGNLPAFSGGIPLGPWLEDQFNLPVFINNDGDLFTYGEAVAGFLPAVNSMLESAGSPKRFNKLFGITLGTGFGGGLVANGNLYLGDNSAAGEIWLMRNKRLPDCYAEEGVSVRAVKGAYARLAGISHRLAPEPKEIYEIGLGKAAGNKAAALGSFAEFGETIGDALANIVTMLDCIIVVGGGVSHAYPLFIKHVLREVNGTINSMDGTRRPRIVQECFDLESKEGRDGFVAGLVREVVVPGSGKTLRYDAAVRTGIGRTVLGASDAVSVGAYAYALHVLDGIFDPLRAKAVGAVTQST